MAEDRQGIWLGTGHLDLFLGSYVLIWRQQKYGKAFNLEFDGFFECLKRIVFEHDLYNVIYIYAYTHIYIIYIIHIQRSYFHSKRTYFQFPWIFEYRSWGVTPYRAWGPKFDSRYSSTSHHQVSRGWCSWGRFHEMFLFSSHIFEPWEIFFCCFVFSPSEILNEWFFIFWIDLESRI